MLKVSHLSLKYGTHTVFSDISFSVGKGEIMCVYGCSGCGKTSLLRAILGFVETEGVIVVDGLSLCPEHVEEIRRRTAYVPQELALPSESVREAVMTPFLLRANRRVPFSESKLLDDWALLGLEGSLLDKRANEISGGQRQRVMLSAAGLLGKSLLLVDEPTSALDEDHANLVLHYFRMLAETRGMAIIVVSHSPLFQQLPHTLHL